MDPPVVDCDLSEFAGMEAMVLDSLSQFIVNREQYRGSVDMRAQIRAGWSEDALHFAIEVTDDELVDVEGTSVWATDSVVLFFDGRADEDRTADDDNLVLQTVLPVLRGADENFTHDAMVWAVNTSQTGYTMEATVPYQLVRGDSLQSPVTGELVRFDLWLVSRIRG